MIRLLRERLEQLRSDQTVKQFSGGTFSAWKGNVRAILLNGLGESAKVPSYQFESATRYLPMPDSAIIPGWQEESYEDMFNQKLPNVEATLANIIWQLETFGQPYVLSEKGEAVPKAFVAHGPMSKGLEKLQRFLITLGIQPLIIEEKPSEGRSINEQVEYYLEQADCAIVLGTADDKELKDGKLYPRRNVHIEIGRFQERFPDKIVYLLEEGASLPLNISEKVYTHFNQDNMEEAFFKVVRELIAFGLLKASKLGKEQA